MRSTIERTISAGPEDQRHVQLAVLVVAQREEHRGRSRRGAVGPKRTAALAQRCPASPNVGLIGPSRLATASNTSQARNPLNSSAHARVLSMIVSLRSFSRQPEADQQHDEHHVEEPPRTSGVGLAQRAGAGDRRDQPVAAVAQAPLQERGDALG